MGFETIAQLNIPASTVVVDIDQVGDYYPTLACVGRGKAEADDKVFIESTELDCEKAIMFRFESEVSDRGSLFGIQGGRFSDYAVFLTENGRFFATKVTINNGSMIPDLSQKYMLSPADRVALVLAQSLDCYAFSLAENQRCNDFASVHSLAVYVEQNPNQLIAEGVQTQASSSEDGCAAWDLGCMNARMYDSSMPPFWDF